MPIPEKPSRDDIRDVARGNAGAIERLFNWMDEVSRALAQVGIGQQPAMPTSGGSVALAPDQRPLSAADAQQLVGIYGMLSNGTMVLVDPSILAAAPTGGFWLTNGGSSPSTGIWTLAYDLNVDGADINVDTGNVTIDGGSLNVLGAGSRTMEIDGTSLIFGSGLNFMEVSPSTLTSSRAVNLQDASGTLALLEVAQTWTAAQTFSDNWIASKRAIYTANTQTITAVTDTVDPNVSPSIRLTKATAGNITFTSLPTVLDGAVDEQEIVIQVDESSNANFVFTRDASLSGSGLFLGAATRTVQPGGALVLRWNADRDGWEEISFITTTK